MTTCRSIVANRPVMKDRFELVDRWRFPALKLFCAHLFRSRLGVIDHIVYDHRLHKVDQAHEHTSGCLLEER